MKTRFFFVLYPFNKNVNAILDGMKIVADPLQRSSSHITVKGPYNRKEKERLTEDSKLIKGKEIRVSGAGNFFVENQNTVFLRCEDKEELYTIWKGKKERTYKQFHPHITIYDGNDRAFADTLYGTINSHNINFSFLADKLDLYSSAEKEKLFTLRSLVDYSLLSQISGIPITQDNVGKLDDNQRITAIDKLCDALGTIADFSPMKSNEHHRVLIEA